MRLYICIAMKKSILYLVKHHGIKAFVPLIIYSAFIIPMLIFFGITWLIGPLQPEKYSALEQLKF